MTPKDKEPVKRVEKIIKEFDENLNVSLLKRSARTVLGHGHWPISLKDFSSISTITE